jgi:hypothetical protein
MAKIEHDVADRTLPKEVNHVTPAISPNISVVPPAPSNGGSVQIVGMGTDRRMVDVAGPYKFEVERQPRDV